MNLKQFGVLLSVSTILGMNVIANKALAADPSITFGNAITSGDCRIINTDGRTLLLALDNFSAYNGARKRCIVRVDTGIPSGFRVQNVQVLYQGSAAVGPRSRGVTFSRTYSFSGGAYGQVFAPPQVSKYETDEPALAEQDTLAVLSSRCGGNGVLGFNLLAQSTSGSNIEIDTADIIVHFNLSPC